MRKVILSFLILIVGLSIVGCSSPENNNNIDNNISESQTLYSEEYMGVWYGFGSDGDEAQFKFVFSPIDDTSVSVTRSGWGTNSKLTAETKTITFISEMVAESSLNNGVKEKYVFGADGKQSIVMDYVNASATPVAQSTYIYRESTR